MEHTHFLSPLVKMERFCFCFVFKNLSKTLLGPEKTAESKQSAQFWLTIIERGGFLFGLYFFYIQTTSFALICGWEHLFSKSHPFPPQNVAIQFLAWGRHTQFLYFRGPFCIQFKCKCRGFFIILQKKKKEGGKCNRLVIKCRLYLALFYVA